MRRDGIDDPVSAHFGGIIDPDRHAEVNSGIANDERRDTEISLTEMAQVEQGRRHDCRHDASLNGLRLNAFEVHQLH